MSDTNTILIVDDESLARDIIEGFLFREGYDLHFAGGGVEALEIIPKINPDLILLDVMMPEIDGFEMCRHLESEIAWQNVPIILITALDSKQDLARGIDSGADDFLTKPVNDVELRARVRSMLRIKNQYDKLEAILELREDLTHMIVHDIRNPLTAIMGYSGLLLRHSDIPPEDLGSIRDIQSQARRLNSMLNDMLILAKMEAKRLLLNRTGVDLNLLLQRVQANHLPIAQSRQINLVIQLPLESQPVSLDVNLFERVLDNLLSNAIKFSPHESSVTLQVEYPQTGDFRARIKVLDEGPGIPREDRERIFDKFEIAGMKEQGALQIGLGLVFCKMVVDAHKGHIFVEPNYPAGSVFVVEI